MMEVVIGSITALLVFISTLFLFRNQIKLLGAINNESEMIGENLNHVASAIVGLSELLEEADQVIEEASKIPTAGEMVQQMLVGFMAQKFGPMLNNTINPINPQGQLWSNEAGNAKAEEVEEVAQ